MKGIIIYGPRDVRSETRPDPTILAPTDFRTASLDLLVEPVALPGPGPLLFC